jgi:hypothetical protein
MNFNYSGDNSAIDNIVPVMPAFSLFRNQTPSYFCAIAYDGGNYKTIGSSFEFGGLVDGSLPSTKQELMAHYLEFFDLNTAPLPSIPALLSPVNSATIDSSTVSFIWQRCQPEVSQYWIEIDSTDQFITAFLDTTISDTFYTYSNLVPGKSYWWKVKAGNAAGWGNFSEIRSFTTMASSIEPNILPVETRLSQNYPNPFNPVTKILYTVKEKTKVKLSLFDVLGREVIQLVNTNQNAGKYEVQINATNLTSGIYYYRLTAGEFSAIRKMILIK